MDSPLNDIPQTENQQRYQGRHRPSTLSRTVFAAIATATILATGLTAASGHSTGDSVPSAAAAEERVDDRADRNQDRQDSTEAAPPADSPQESDPQSQDAPDPKPAKEAPEPTKEAPKPDWVAPSDAKISDVYGPREWRNGEMHDGMDFAAWTGDPNFAAADGVVTQAGSNGGYGISVIIDHGNGVETVYGHHSDLKVSVGDKVSAGDTIGLAGTTGDITGPHLHFEVHVNGQPTDPQDYLEDKGVKF